ncbi:MAG: putative transport system permease protein [Mycobacterium sp.]|nr:putative transport system permease protein [Mycobacterium sp.]
MTFSETFRTALEAMRTHRMRSMLTMLGILIGIAAVILTVGLGQGAQAQVSAEISKLGSNLLIVTPGSATSTTGIRGGRGTTSTLTIADAAALSTPSVAPDIAAVAATSTSSQSVVAGSTNWTTNIVGTTPSWAQVRARTLSSGRFITQDDLDQGRAVAVLGSETVAQLFGGGSAVGQTVTINGSTFTVIGVMDSLGATTAANEDDQIIVPQTTFAARVTGSTTRSSVSSIYIEGSSKDTLTAAYQEAYALLLSRHNVTATTADFTLSSQQSLVNTATSTDRTLTILLAGVAAISLLVGGIGVMNIMLVSVTERIREIGLRKALGATPAAIRRQFLVEASSLGATGGVLGVGLAFLGAAVLPHLLNQPVTISPSIAAGAVGVALVIGITAGVYPAGRAARLAPIDALRNE